MSSLYGLKKDGWFDPPTRIDLNLSLGDADIKRLRNYEKIMTEKDGRKYLIYIRESTDLRSMDEDDLIIREIFI